MRIWRICKKRWAASAYDGEGARSTGGRWNHPGDAVVYAAESLALAAWETFVHVDPSLAPDDLVAISAELPDRVSTEALTAKDLPRSWRTYPAPAALRTLGSEWIRSRRTLLLILPFAVIPAERCVLVNPAHPEFRKIVVRAPGPFEFDSRIWGR